MSKALKVTGLVVLIIVVAAALAWGGYAFATWQNNKSQDNTANTNNNNGNNATPNTPVAPSKPTTVATCNADELALTTEGGNPPGAGTLALNIVLTNTGARECSLFGYPGVSLVNNNGNQIGQPAGRATNYPENTIKLAPGASTTAILTYPEAGNFDPGTCADGATKLRVYPPNDTGYISVAQTAITSWCPGFETSPVE